MDPKLIQARAEIEAILTKHDIAAHVILHNARSVIEAAKPGDIGRAICAVKGI